MYTNVAMPFNVLNLDYSFIFYTWVLTMRRNLSMQAKPIKTKKIIMMIIIIFNIFVLIETPDWNDKL